MCWLDVDGLSTGPDGFPIAADDPLRAAHESLSGFLIEDAAREEAHAKPDDRRWKKLPKPLAIEHVEAILRRLTWLLEHDRELPAAHVDRLRLVRLLRVLYTVKLPCTERDLRALLDLTGPLLDAIAPFGPVECVVEYLRNGDLTPELCASLRRFQSLLPSDVSGQAAMQSLRQTLHMLLWMDEWELLNPAHCWSECVRRDFRAMTGDRRVRWRRLFKQIRGNAPVRMPAGWAREAEPRLAEVGVEDFREQLAVWFAPFQSGQPLPLSVAGSHVLKGLLWFAALTRDEETKRIALGLLDVKWKQKRNVEKSMVALEVLGISREELQARQLVKPDTPRAGLSLLDKLFNTRVLSGATHVAVSDDGDLVLVQGELHYYRLSRTTGRIERATDDVALELDWHALPDHMRSMIRPSAESVEQVMLRAHLLLHDSVFGRYFVTLRRSKT